MEDHDGTVEHNDSRARTSISEQADHACTECRRRKAKVRYNKNILIKNGIPNKSLSSAIEKSHNAIIAVDFDEHVHMRKFHVHP